MDNSSSNGEKALDEHKKHRGKIEIIGKVPLENTDDLSIYYTPGVAHVSKAIGEDKERSYEYTNRANTIAIVTDGTRVLGLGDLGPEAEMPVIEGKALIFKKFGGVDAIPIAVNSKDEGDIVKFVKMIEPTVAAINIEDIKSPKVFNITKRLKSELGIPVFHDDKDGTGIVTRAGLINALKLAKKSFKNVKVVVNGAGAAGQGIAEILLASGVNDMIVCDTNGAIFKGRSANMDEFKNALAEQTNTNMLQGSLPDVAKNADVLIGASSQGAFTFNIIKGMNDNPIVFALANPYPEIDYNEALSAGAFIAATGRSDRPNQINNSLAFPGFFRGLLSSRAKFVNNGMLIAASDAIASCVRGSQLKPDSIVPKLDGHNELLKMTGRVAMAVAKAAMSSNAAMVQLSEEEIKMITKEFLDRYKKIEKTIKKLNSSRDL